MTLDTEPTIRLPVVDVPSAVITTDLHIARARANSARRARIQRRWDLLARILSYLLFGGTLGLLIGICGALFALALTLAGHDGAVPAPESTTTTASLTLPSMPPTAYPLLGGVAPAPTTTRPATTRATRQPTTTTQATASAPATSQTTAATQPATTAPPPATEPATTTTTAPPSSTTVATDTTTTSTTSLPTIDTTEAP